MHALLDALGQPQTQLRVAHISGTKGKGSTAVMLSSIMKAANYKVGTYTRYAFKLRVPCIWTPHPYIPHITFPPGYVNLT